MARKMVCLGRLIVVLALALATFSSSLFVVPSGVALASSPSDEPEPPLPEDLLPVDADLTPEPAVVSSSPVTHTIRLQSREFVPSAPNVQTMQRLARTDVDRVHILLQLDFIPRQAAKEALEARGIELLAYVPDYAWLASVPAKNPSMVLQQPGVMWAGALAVEDKLAPAIVKGRWGDYNLAPDGTAAVYVALYPDVNLEVGRKSVAAYGGQITGEVVGTHMLVVEMPRDNIRQLAAEDIVQWIEPSAPPLLGANDGSRPHIGVDVLQAAPYNLDGTNVDVLVYDSGQVGDHVDFGTRLIHGDTDWVSAHSTHVAGTVGGSGANSAAQGGSALEWRGMAPNADLISYGTAYPDTTVIFYENVPDIEHDWAQAQNWYGADIGSASLGSNIYANYYPSGCSLMGLYGASSVLIDQIVRGGNSVVGIGDKYIATWAAGNERGWSTSCGTYGIVAPPAAAKNPIHVGGSNTNNTTQYAHTSWGPTQDGRLKPIVTAGGCQTTGDYGIKSTDNYPANAYTAMCGTSMATPAVAGGIALMLQHYRDVYNTSGRFWPSTAKAILMQTAHDQGRPGPDYQWGYGLVDIQDAVDLISRKAFRQESLAHGDVDVYYFIVPDDTNPATVSLAWDDFEATFNANPTLINNLDLELIAPDGTPWRPWVLDPGNPTSDATRGLDTRNNQEQVQVPASDIQVGTWLVRVKGTSVPQGPQDYALVCEGCQPLDLGVCQPEVSGATQRHSAILDTADGVIERAAGDVAEELYAETPLPPTPGEVWQRGLERAKGASQVSEQVIEHAELQSALASFEVAREVGSRAVVDLAQNLSPAALDVLDGELIKAQEKLAESTPPPPEMGPVSEIDEETALANQEVVESANRLRALTSYEDPAEGTNVEAPSRPNVGPVRALLAPMTLTVGADCTYATIGDAIAAANPGDILLVEGGRTFVENLYVPISLTVQGGYDGCASASTARTTVDGDAADSVVYIASGLDVTLENLNLTNGSSGMEGGGIRFATGTGTGQLTLTNVDIYNNTGYWGGGLWVGVDAEVVGTNVEIYNNTAMSYGGGLRLYGGRATFDCLSGATCNIRDNSASMGGGVYATLEGGAVPRLDLPANTDVYNNQALSGDGFGGGVYMRQGTVTIADCSDLRDNIAIAGGGAYLVTSTLTIDGSCSEIQYNEATGDGGGVYAQGSYVNVDDEAWIFDNDAGTDGSGSGGGAYLDDSQLYSDKGAIYGNAADDYGGGVYATNGSIVDMDLGTYTCFDTRCSRLAYNTADRYGGGIYARESSVVYLNNTFVEDNTGELGGALYIYDSAVYVYNNLLARNNATSTAGDAIRLYTDASMSGAGNTLAYNDSGGAATGRAIDLSSATLSLHCSVIWGHTSAINETGHDVTYSDIQGGYIGTGNIALNPLFVNVGSQDYHLQATSPVIDRCAYFSGMNIDFENEIRPIVRSTAATPYDMGADEVAGVERVGINGAGCAYATIQQAVNAAVDGDTLQVAEGVYFEAVDIRSGLDITIEGSYDGICTTSGGGTTRVEGSAGTGSTFDIDDSASVTLRDLQIAWGSGTGGGIEVSSNAQVTLDNTDVLNNHGTYGGGVYISANSVMTVENDSDIYDNTATVYGGGGRVWGQLFAYNTLSDIYDNCAPHGGGFSVSGGELSLDAADVYSNEAADAAGKGGGIYVTEGGRVSLSNGAYVYFLNQAYDGAGIYADDAEIHMEDATTTLRDNVATHYGGGMYLTNNSILNSDGARIGQPGGAGIANEAVHGAGLYVENSTVNFSGQIVNNVAWAAGGGIYATNSEINLTDAQVGGTNEGDPNQLTAAGASGSGLYLTDGTQATLSNTVVASNTFQTAGISVGGGACVLNDSTLTLINSRVERHTAPSSGASGGLGIAVSNATVTLDNSEVLSNTALSVGGGLYLAGTSTLNVLNGSSIMANEASGGEGGGIYAIGTPDINITDATLQYNTAGTDGGAIYLDDGTLDFNGWWDLRHNLAYGNGGAVAVMGTGDMDMYVTDGTFPSYLAVNRAYGNGGALYLGSGDLAAIYTHYGHPLNLNTNIASDDGGAVFIGDGLLYIYGDLVASSNAAGGNGGVFYSAGKPLYLLGVGDNPIQIWVNSAQNGGAIYAQNSSPVYCWNAEFGSSSNGNQATAGQGGALYLGGSNFTAYSCVFRNGRATGHGGAIAAYTSTLVIDANYGICDPLVEQCSSLYNNQADVDATNNGYGGAIYVNDSKLTIDHTYLHDNSAVLGGAIYQIGGTSGVGQVYNSLIYSNTVATTGAGIRVFGGVFTLTHATIVSNTGSAGFSPTSGTVVSVTNSMAWGNSGGGFAVDGTYAITDCNIDQDGYAGLVVDPKFVAPGLGNYHLVGDSPAIDRCATGLSKDLDNASRPVAAGYDVGAFEYAYAIEFVPDNADLGYPLTDVLYTHTLTNAGGITDTYILSAVSDHGWPVVVDPSPSVKLGEAQATLVTVTLSVPAGVLSDTVDTTVVTAMSSLDNNLTKQVTDTTTIGFAPGVAFRPDYTTINATEGADYVYTHWLTNTGNATDTFALDFSTSAGWGSLSGGYPTLLGPGDGGEVSVTVQVPLNGTGLSDTSLVTATSTGGAGPVVVRDITSAFTPEGAFTPDHVQTVAEDTVLTYTHTLTNSGNSTDTFHMTTSSALGWGTLVDGGPFMLIEKEVQSVRVRVTVPPGSGGMMDTTWVTATSAAGAAPVGVRDTTSVLAPGLAFAPDYVETIPTNSAITYTHRLTNTGAAPDTFDVGLASSSEGWATLVDVGPFALSMGAGTDVRVRVDAPDGSGGLTDVTVITATSRAGSLSGISARVTDTTTAVRVYGVDFAPDHIQSLDPGEVMTYTHWLTNTGSGTDKFHLDFDSSEGWSTLLDPGPFELLMDEGISVHVRVDVPTSSGGLVDVATILAYSELSPTVTASVTDTTTSIYAPEITLLPNYHQSVSPGIVLTYTHWLTNDGNGPDQFVVDFESSEGWATLLETGPFNLDAGEGLTLNVRVDVPDGAGGLVDTSLLTATSYSAGISAVVTDTTTAIHTPGVNIAPDYAESVVPEATFIYVHTLKNTGNGFDTYSVTLTSSADWATLLDPGPFSLAAGESTEVRVSALVPSGLISGTASDIAVLTATSYADPSLSDTATDTTTVGYAPSALFERDYLTVGALPNDTFVYTHWLTNTGNHTDTFEVTLDSSVGWATLLDPGPFDLGLGASATMRVQVDVPSDGTGKFDVSAITVTSQGGVAPLAVHDVTAAFVPDVDLTPNYDNDLNPGDVITLTHTLTNTGNSPDTIRLSLDTSRGWSHLLDPGPHTLLSGASIAVRVVITAPIGSGGLEDVTILEAVTLDGWGPSAQVTDTTTAIYQPGIALEPDYMDIAPAGSIIVYTHWLTNTGNGPDVFSVTLHSSMGWGTLVDPGPFILGADGSTDVQVQVSVPTNTLLTDVDMTMITATSELGGLSASATDTTSLVCEALVGADFVFTPSPAKTARPVVFTGTVTAGSLPIAYTWNFGDMSAEQAGSPVTHTFMEANTFTVWVTATNACPSVVTATRQVEVVPHPDISVLPMTLAARLSPDTAVTQMLTISNVGDADLTWTLTETPTVGWLGQSLISATLAPSAGRLVSVTYDASGLADAIYTTTLHVASNDLDAPLLHVPVVLTVATPAPAITVTPAVLESALPVDGIVTQTLTLGNIGDLDLSWSLTEVLTVSWLREWPTSGIILPLADMPVDIVFDATGVISGTYTTTLRIANNDPDAPVVDVPVILVVSGGDISIYLPMVMRDH